MDAQTGATRWRRSTAPGEVNWTGHYVTADGCWKADLINRAWRVSLNGVTQPGTFPYFRDVKAFVAATETEGSPDA